jgi:hypothetical protein
MRKFAFAGLYFAGFIVLASICGAFFVAFDDFSSEEAGPKSIAQFGAMFFGYAGIRCWIHFLDTIFPKKVFTVSI